MTDPTTAFIAGSQYASAFVVGLLGAGHCIGMCGGITGALVFSLPESVRASYARSLPYLLAYNLGRILTYGIAGGLVAGLGLLMGGLMPVQTAQQILLVLAALFMIAMGLYLAGWWFGLQWLEKAGGIIWQRIQPVARKMLPVSSPGQALLMGLIWGWLPCGLVYSVLIWTLSTGSVAKGALLMLAFGAGTLPALLATGSLANVLSSQIRKPWVRMLAGGLIIAFGISMLGMAMGIF